MNILILAAGEGSTLGTGYPIWLSEMNGQILLERQVRTLSSSSEDRLIFAFQTTEIEGHHVDSIARQVVPTAAVVTIKGATAGAACTAMLAITHLNLDDELVVASATDHVDVDFDAILSWFRGRKADAGVLTFDSLHPRYSFVMTDEDDWVLEAAEKRPISRRASAGIYWYARARDFIESIQNMVLKDAHVNGVFYICPSLNEMVLTGKKIAAWQIPASTYHPLKELRHFDSLEQRAGAGKHHAP